MKSIVSMHGISHSYDSRLILSGVSLSLRSGEIVGVTGASGSGKSTLLRLAAGLERPERGEVKHGGNAIWREGKRGAAGGFALPIFQNPQASLDPAWPIWRSITEPLWRERLSQRRRYAISEALLHKAGLGEIDPRALPGELSGGQCQRVAILRAIAGKPALIIADEPTSALDAASGLRVRKLLQDAAEAGSAVLIASHDDSELSALADRRCRIIEATLLESRHSRGLRNASYVGSILERRQRLRSRMINPHVPSIDTP